MAKCLSFIRILISDCFSPINSSKNRLKDIAAKAKIVIIHSEDDMTVPIEAGFTIYKKHFKNDKRFKFVKLLQHGHGTVYYTLEGKKYYEKIHKEFNKYVKSNKPSELEKEEFLKKLIDRKIYNNLVDVKALKKYIDFITK